MQKTSLITFLLFVFFTGSRLFYADSCFSQEINVKKIKNSILIDGKLNEVEWKDADLITGFTQYEPSYGTPSKYKTIVKVLYNNKMIYIGVECLDPDPSRISAKITNRDGSVDDDDSIIIGLDTFNDGNNAYSFIVNSLGTQKDMRIADNGRTEDNDWDAGWFSAGSVNENGWSAEVGIPFEIIKFNSKAGEWGFNIGRFVPRDLEESYWIKDLVSSKRISQYGKIKGLDLKSVSGTRLTVIPYGQMQLRKGVKGEEKFGADIRYKLSSNLSADATVNPDFATVEADIEQVNLTKFELWYPEKRPFFLEGAENYRTRVRQFYSRRIGEIPWGFKLTGKVDKWKINMLATQSDPSTAGKNVEKGNDAYYQVFRINRDISKSSNIGLIGANRNYMSENSGSLGLAATLFFTRTLGMTSQVIKSYGEQDKGTWTYFLRPAFDSQTGHFHVRYSHFGEGVRENMNSTGYISDDNRKEFDTNVKKSLWVNRYGIDEIEGSVNYNRYWSQAGDLRSWGIRNNFEVNFLKKWNVEVNHIEEFKAFDIVRFDKDYRNSVVETELRYDSKTGKSVFFGYGKGINWDRDFEEITGSMGLRLMEGWNLSYKFSKYWFSPDLEDENSWIHYVRTSYYFNKDMFFKLFYQSNYSFARGFTDPQFDLTNETVQLVFVWRIIPPFGSLQLAFQKGRTLHTEESNDESSFFTKFSWVF